MTLLIAVLGAESTGKTTLAQQLAVTLAASPFGLKSACVPEVLRQWCDRQGRTPKRDEQDSILEQQHAHIEAACQAHEAVVCDTTGLMTAVYSRIVFGDHHLDARAVAWHRRVSLTLLMALDLPWVADGHQRDGPHVQKPVDQALRELMIDHRLPFAVISGEGPARLQHALAAVTAVRPRATVVGEKAARRLFTHLADRQQASAEASPVWLCECCAEAPYERALRAQRASTAGTPGPADGHAPG